MTYHTLNIQNCCAGINVPFCSNRASWEFDWEAPLKLLHMVFYISVHRCDIHKLARVNFTKPFNINWPPLFVNSVITMRIILQNSVQLTVLEILWNKYNSRLLFWRQSYRCYIAKQNLKCFMTCAQLTNLNNCISAILLPPLKHICPHLLCFLDIHFPCFQKSTNKFSYVWAVDLCYKNEKMHDKLS